MQLERGRRVSHECRVVSVSMRRELSRTGRRGGGGGGRAVFSPPGPPNPEIGGGQTCPSVQLQMQVLKILRMSHIHAYNVAA